jgi:hypothetical protein
MTHVHPFLAVGKSVVFQTKLGAWLGKSTTGKQPGDGDCTHDGLHDICKVVAHSDEQGALLGVLSADLVDPR